MTDPSLLILASLVTGEKHAYAMIEDIQRFADVPLGPGTLYGVITRLEGRGWIRPSHRMTGVEPVLKIASRRLKRA